MVVAVVEKRLKRNPASERMMDTMEYTGERVVPEFMKADNGMLLEHMERYNFAKDYVFGRLLDLACGVGYGADILLDELYDKKIESYLGIDLSKEAIAYAREMYGFQKTQFEQGDALDRSLEDRYGEFDTILSFETIEHIEEDEEYVQNLTRLLHNKGTLIISTPFGKGRDVPCASPYHIRQYLEEEFVDLLENWGFEVELFYQRGQKIEKAKPGEKYFLMVALCRFKN